MKQTHSSWVRQDRDAACNGAMVGSGSQCVQQNWKKAARAGLMSSLVGSNGEASAGAPPLLQWDTRSGTGVS